MKVQSTAIHGCKVITPELLGDERGFFARALCVQELSRHGVCTSVVQVNNSFNARAGTLRGMHYQLPPCAEDKMVRCIRGSLFDVALDMRPDSSTFGQWFGVELSAENRKMLFVPQGCAHGFMTLQDDTELLYFVSEFYAPEHERAVRYDDPRFAIRWPMAPSVISDKDRNAPAFDPAIHFVQQQAREPEREKRLGQEDL